MNFSIPSASKVTKRLISLELNIEKLSTALKSLEHSLSGFINLLVSKQGSSFKPGPFLPPLDPSSQLCQLQSEIEKLKTDLTNANVELDSSKQLNDLIKQEKVEFEALALAMDEESKQLAELAKEHELALAEQKKEYESKLLALQKKLELQDEKASAAQKQKVSANARRASQHIVLSEELTRILIDQQLSEAGWAADSQEQTYQNGARPEKGVNKAIAEWPTKYNGEGGRADYVLFHGLIPIAVVEAKKENTNVAGKIPQAERYSKGFQLEGQMQGAWEVEGQTVAWPDELDDHYKVPFVYSCNGRPYLPQLKEQSGTWFRDVRDFSNTKRALQQFHTPDGLMDLLKRSKQEAEHALQKEGFAYLKLRDYQEKAITAVENTLAKNIRSALLAMATGTEKLVPSLA